MNRTTKLNLSAKPVNILICIAFEGSKLIDLELLKCAFEAEKGRGNHEHGVRRADRHRVHVLQYELRLVLEEHIAAAHSVGNFKQFWIGGEEELVRPNDAEECIDDSTANRLAPAN